MASNLGRAPFHYLLLVALALSILTLPLVLLTKVTVGAAQFSVSYVFICAIFGWSVIAALHRLTTRRQITLGNSVLLPGAFLCVVGMFTGANGVEPAFLMSMLFWCGSTYLGLLIDQKLSIAIVKQTRVIAFFASVLGIVLYTINFPLLDLESLASDMYFVNDWGHYRAASIFLNPNSFAYFLILAFCGEFYGQGAFNIRRLAALAVLLTAFFLTGSRSGFIAFAILVAYFGMQQFKSRVRFAAYCISNLCLLSVLVLLVCLSGYLTESDVRFEKWAFSMDLFLKSREFWLTGIPADVKLEKLGLFFSDNMYLMVMFRMGVVGFLLFALYYAHILWRAMQCLVWCDRATWPFAAFIMVCSILLFYSNFFYFYPLVLLHGIAAGQVLRADRQRLSPVNQKAVQ